MAVKYDAIRLQNWQGGLNRSLSDFEIADNELWTALNCLVDSAAIRKRPGYVKLNTSAIGGGADVLSIYEFYDGSSSHILLNCGTVIYEIDSNGDTTEIVTGLTAGYPVSFATYGWVVYMSNGKDSVWKWNGTDAAEELATLPKAKWLIEHRDKLFYLQAFGEDANKVFFSQAAKPEVIDDDAEFIVYTDDGDSLAGVASLFGYLMLFKNLSTHRLQGARKDQLILSDNLVCAHPRVGCVAHNSIVHVPGGVLFLSDEGIQFTDSSAIAKQSGKVDYFLSKIAEAHKENSCAFWDGKNYRVSYPTGTNSLPNETLCYNLQNRAWTLFNYGMNAYFVARDGTIYAAGQDGFIYLIDQGLSDADSEIEMRVESKVFDLGTPYMTKVYRYAGVDTHNGKATLELILSLDRGIQSYLKTFEAKAGETRWGVNNWAIDTGTVEVTNGSPNVTGDGDVVWTDVAVGDSFQIDGDAAIYTVLSCDAVAKTLVLTGNYEGTLGSGKTYVMWNSETLFWTEPLPSYEKFSLPKRLKGKNIQIQFREEGADSDIEIYGVDVRLLSTLGR